MQGSMEFELFAHQIAGHGLLLAGNFNSQEETKENKSKESYASVLKPFNEKEYMFYKLLTSLDSNSIVKFTPNFFDAADVKDRKYIVLENVLCGFKRPSLIDIKLGTILYDADASQLKMERMKNISQSTTSGSLGIRITGMKYYNDQGELIFFSKEEGKELTPDTILKKALIPFFQKFIKSNAISIRYLINDLLQLKISLESSQPGISIHSSSLLIAFDNFPNECSKYVVKLIDFAHSEFLFNSNGVNSDLIYGLNNLIDLLQKCV